MSMKYILNYNIQDVYYYFYFLSAEDDKECLPLTTGFHVLLLLCIMYYTVVGFND